VLKAGEVHVWRVVGRSDVHAVLGRYTDAALDFAFSPTGKPWLPAAPYLKFNLSHSKGAALVAVALEVEVGVDIERYRPLPDHHAIASRFFPPSEAAAHQGEDERDFFRRWTRIEAMLKALGLGLFGIGKELEGEWTVRAIDVGEEYAAAVAATCAGMSVILRGDCNS
jgi:4'-phosphopantetheinyl transferase